MIPMKKHYDAGELFGEKMRGMMACTMKDSWYNTRARPLVTADAKKVTCGKCKRKMEREQNV